MLAATVSNETLCADTPTKKEHRALNDIRKVLLQKGLSLQKTILSEIKSTADTEMTFWNSLSETMWESTTKRLEAKYQSFYSEFAPYDEQVSLCLVKLSTLQTELFTQMPHASYAFQISNERNTIRRLLSDFHGIISRYSSDTRSLVIAGTSLIAAFVSALSSLIAIYLVVR